MVSDLAWMTSFLGASVVNVYLLVRYWLDWRDHARREACGVHAPKSAFGNRKAPR